MNAPSSAPAPGKQDDSDVRSTLREVRELMHDIRNHMNGILGLVSLLLLQSSDPVSVRLRPLVESQAQQLTYLMDQLPAGLTGASPVQSTTRFTAARFVPALLELYRPFAAEHGMRLVHAIDAGLPDLDTDVRALHRLLSNLLVNAIKHSQASQVSLSVRHDGGEALRFAVADDGVGIERPALAALQAVLQGQMPASLGYDRSGFAICAGLAGALGATLVLDSEPGHGTTVVIDWPLLPPAA